MLPVNQKNLPLSKRKLYYSKHTTKLALDIHLWLKKWETGDSHFPLWSKSRDPAPQPLEHPTWIAQPVPLSRKRKVEWVGERVFPQHLCHVQVIAIPSQIGVRGSLPVFLMFAQMQRRVRIRLCLLLSEALGYKGP